MALVAAINFRGVGESVKANIVLTLVELSGLLLVIFVGFFALFGGAGDWSRTVIFESPGDKSAFFAVTAATSLAFFAMVGFEDSVNMAEETKDPVRIFPKMMLTGLGITGVIYVLISLCSVALVPVGVLADSDTPLVTVVETAAPGVPIKDLLPFISMFAVANSALINMLMASRLLYGMSRQDVLPHFLGRVHPTRKTPYAAIIFTTLIAFGLIAYVSFASSDAIAALGGTTSLLLLGVFTIVNIVVLVLRRDPKPYKHFVTPSVVPVIGALACFFLVLPMSGRPIEHYKIGGGLLVLGVAAVGAHVAGQPRSAGQEDLLPRHRRPQRRRSGQLAVAASGEPASGDGLGTHLALDPGEHGDHAAQAQRRDRLGETEAHRGVVGDGQHLGGGEPVETLVQDAGEAAGRRGLGRSVEEEVHVALLERRALVDLDGQEERRLALVDALELVEVTGIPLGQRGQLVTELEEQRELEVVARRAEVVGDLGERARQGVSFARCGAGHRTHLSIGTRTALPHSVHEPS